MNRAALARLRTLEAVAARKPRPAPASLPTDPDELRKAYDAMVSGPSDPALAGLRAAELVDRYRRMVSR